MSCFIYLEMADKIPESFTKDKIEWVKECLPHVITFDLDNFSDALLKNYAIQLIHKNKKQVLYLQMSIVENSRSSLNFIEKAVAASPSLLLLSNMPNNFIEILANQYKLKYYVADARSEMEMHLKNYYYSH